MITAILELLGYYKASENHNNTTVMLNSRLQFDLKMKWTGNRQFTGTVYTNTKMALIEDLMVIKCDDSLK